MLLSLSQSSFLLSFSIVIYTESFVTFLKRITINSIPGSLFKGECIFHLEKGMLKKKKEKKSGYLQIVPLISCSIEKHKKNPNSSQVMGNLKF